MVLCTLRFAIQNAVGSLLNGSSISFSGRKCRQADKTFAFPARTEYFGNHRLDDKRDLGRLQRMTYGRSVVFQLTSGLPVIRPEPTVHSAARTLGAPPAPISKKAFHILEIVA